MTIFALNVRGIRLVPSVILLVGYIYFLIAHFQTRDKTRSLVNKQDSSTPTVSTGGGGVLVSSLRQQVHSLEVALRGKEGEVLELRSGVATSRLKEMEIQTDTYYREICR